MDPYRQKPHPWPSEGAPHLAEALQVLWLPEAIPFSHVLMTQLCLRPGSGLSLCPESQVSLPSIWGLSWIGPGLGLRLGSRSGLSLGLGQGSVSSQGQDQDEDQGRGCLYSLGSEGESVSKFFRSISESQRDFSLSRNYGPAGTPAKWGRGRAGQGVDRAGQGVDRAVGCGRSTGLQ